MRRARFGARMQREPDAGDREQIGGWLSLIWSIGGMVFMASAAAEVACWAVAAVEAVGIWRFWPWAFRLGLKIIDRRLPRPTNPSPVTGRLNSRDLRAAVIDQRHILFRAPMSVFRFRIRTPFPIHGAATLEADGVYVTGRIPLGAVGFFLAWISGWTTGGVMAGSQVPIGGFGMVALGWLFVGGMIIFSVFVERPRFERALEALLREISCDPAGYWRPSAERAERGLPQ